MRKKAKSLLALSLAVIMMIPGRTVQGADLQTQSAVTETKNSGSGKIKIACTGDSITYGDMSSDPAKYSYPSQLQAMLGDEYEVHNYGINGSTLTQSDWCDRYLETEESEECQSWQPDVIFVMLGTNDSQDSCWISANGRGNYERDLKELVNAYKGLPSQPEIYLATSPCAGEENQYGIRPEVLSDEIVPIQKKVAEELECHLIDMHKMTAGFDEMGLMSKVRNGQADLVHPNNEGYLQIAKIMYNGMAEQFGLALTDIDVYEVDCGNEIISYHGSWGDWPDSELFMDTEKYTTNPGDWAEFEFEGTGFQIMGLRNKSVSYMDVYVDGELYRSVDTYMNNSVSRKHESLLAVDGLENKKHTVRIALSSKSEDHHAEYGLKLSLDSIKIFRKEQGFANRIEFGSSTGEFLLSHKGDTLWLDTKVYPKEAGQKLKYQVSPAGAADVSETGLVTSNISEGIFSVTAETLDGSYCKSEQEFIVQSGNGSYTWVDNGDSLVEYTGSWNRLQDEASFGGSTEETHTAGNKVKITFEGTGISIIGKIYPSGNYSAAEVFLDGASAGIISFVHNKPDQAELPGELLFKSEKLEPGTHTLEMIAQNEQGDSHTGECGISLDGFGVYRETACDTEELEKAVYDARVMLKNEEIKAESASKLQRSIYAAAEVMAEAKRQEEIKQAAADVREAAAEAAKEFEGETADFKTENPKYGKITLLDDMGREIGGDASVPCGTRIKVEVRPNKNFCVESLTVNGVKKKYNGKKNAVILQEITVTPNMELSAEINPAKIKIACVGEEVTYGIGSDRPQTKSYPAILQKLLGDGAVVKNFAMPGTCMIGKGNLSYTRHSVYRESLAFCPDIVIVMPGINDAEKQNSGNGEFFQKELGEFLDDYQNLESAPMVCLASMPDTYNAAGQEGGYHDFAAALQNFAEKNKNLFIDINYEMQDLEKGFFTDDGQHLNDDGYHLLAALILQKLELPPYLKLADKSELQLLHLRFKELRKDLCSGGGWEKFQRAYETAGTVLENSEAEPEEVFLAEKELKDAYSLLQFKEKIKIACVGDSITYGHGSSDPSTDSYPAHLQRMLGDRYEVVNFGVSGRAMNPNRGGESYISTWEYSQSKEFQPDLVIIMLGTNDSKDKNWYGEETYLEAAGEMIRVYQELSSRPEIYFAVSPMVAPDEDMRNLEEPMDNYIWNSRLVNVIGPLQRKLAEEMGCRTIDIQQRTAELKDMNDYLSWDLIHPHDAGYELLAAWMYEGLFADWPVDMRDLTDSVRRAEQLELKDYTPETAETLQNALLAAKEALSSKETRERAMENALAARRMLEKAMAELEKKADVPAPNEPDSKQEDQNILESLNVGSQYSEGELEYQVTGISENGGTVIVKRAKNKNNTSIEIPASVKINGKSFQVTAIGDNAFKNNKKLRSVIIGKNVEVIGKKAFSGDRLLKKLIIKTKKLKKVQKKALQGISVKAVIKVPGKKLAKYKKLLKGKGQKASVKIKA